MQIISRKAAFALGLKRYFTGKTCPNGHISENLVVNYTCIKCLHVKYAAKRRITRQAATKARKQKLLALNAGHRLPANAVAAEAKGLTRYYTGKPCPKGHLSVRNVKGHSCVECQREATKTNANKPEMRKKTADQARIRYRKNAPAINAAYRKRRKEDTVFHFVSVLRARIKGALKGKRKLGSALIYLGCSAEEARQHIEKQFLPGMTWENHSYRGWHVDHIKSICNFDLNDEEQRKRAFHFTNLQPLWATDNLRKSKRSPKA